MRMIFGKRGRMAAGGAVLGAALFAVLAHRLPGDHGAAVHALLWIEAAIAGAVGGAASASYFGAERGRGALRAMMGGGLAAALGLALFGAGATLWLRMEGGAPALTGEDLTAALPPIWLAAAAALQALELAALKAEAEAERDA